MVDIDDSIHLFRDEWAAKRLAAVADIVIVGNEWLAEVWGQWSQAVEVLPTAIDTERHALSLMPRSPVIGWIGLGSNLHYLIAIAPALARVVERFPDAVIAVCSDRKPNLPGLPVSYVPWSADAEAPFLSSISFNRRHAAGRWLVGAWEMRVQDAAIHVFRPALRCFAGIHERPDPA
jgi:hypothetical protein